MLAPWLLLILCQLPTGCAQSGVSEMITVRTVIADRWRTCRAVSRLRRAVASNKLPDPEGTAVHTAIAPSMAGGLRALAPTSLLDVTLPLPLAREALHGRIAAARCAPPAQLSIRTRLTGRHKGSCVLATF